LKITRQGSTPIHADLIRQHGWLIWLAHVRQSLFDLLHALRGYRRPVSGKVLTDEIDVSIRTLYRDIAILQALGAAIAG